MAAHVRSIIAENRELVDGFPEAGRTIFMNIRTKF
jgi:hypothetical protein